MAFQSPITDLVQDINRERALAKLNISALLRRLTQEDKADVALGVLCNLCLDYGTTAYLLSTQPN